MYIHLGQPQYVNPGPPPVPMPVFPPAPPPPPPLRAVMVRSQVQCSAAQLGAIRDALPSGTVVTADYVRTAIARAHNGIWYDFVDAEAAPRKDLWKADSARSAEVKNRFLQAFGKRAGDLPWAKARWDLGRIVAARLGGAGKTMFSGSVRISCMGWPWPGGGQDRPQHYLVKALPKQERVALGALFWQADPVSRAAALLAAGLVIRYGISYQLLALPIRSLHCYLKYAITAVGHQVPAWVESKCPQAA